MPDASSLWSLTDGLGVSVSMQSFAVRALLGSVVAAVLAALAARYGWLKSGRARRTMILAPVVAAAAAAVASMAPGSTFLPDVVVRAAAGEPVEILGAEVNIKRLGWVLVVYVAIASFLLVRRAVGYWTIGRYVAAATPCDDPAIKVIVRRLSSKLGIGAPQVLVLRRCPGGAFTSGVRRPLVALDADLLCGLDDRELEGLIAHELAHIARRDVLMNTVVGVIRDLTFFVPPLNLAGRWLRHEQEQSADDLASDSTGRPAALASSILKVWQGSTETRRPQLAAMACATMVPPTAWPLAAGIAGRTAGVPGRMLRNGSFRRGPMRGGAQHIAERVARLIDRGAPLSLRRQRVELTLAMAVVVLATAVTVVLPSQFQSELMLAQWARPPIQPVESPAMASFRTLAPVVPPVEVDHPARTGGATAAIESCVDCVLLESGAEWRAQVSPTLPDRAPGWQGGGRPWADAPQGDPSPTSAQTLWGVDSSNGRLGFFLVQSQRG